MAKVPTPSTRKEIPLPASSETRTDAPIPGVQLGVKPWRKVAGTVVSRALVPAWVFAGATFKLVERDPALLPVPARSVIAEVGSAIGANLPSFLMFSMRTIIGIEFAAVAVMVLFPKWSRMVAVAILTLFLGVLIAVLVQGLESNGIAGLLGDCGCFGSKGPPAPVMFLIDAALLAAVVAFPVTLPAHWKKIEYRMGVITAVVAIAGVMVAYSAPPKTFVPTPVEPGNGEAATPGGSDGTTVVKGPWEAPPPPLEPYYFDKFETWVGKSLASQAIALQISRPLPAGFPDGRWHLVLYRADCDHCHELLENHFSGELETPVLAIEIPDTDPAAALEMPCVECALAKLPAGPSYVITTPVLLTVVDGTVICACENVDDLDRLNECLDAK